MVILKISSEDFGYFNKNYAYVPISYGEDYNYVLVEESINGYEEVSEIPNINGIVDGSFESILEYLSYLSNLRLEEINADYQAELDSSDYKVIKAYEYSLVGLEEPYDISELHKERQSIRDKINSNLEKMKTSKTWDELSDIRVDSR